MKIKQLEEVKRMIIEGKVSRDEIVRQLFVELHTALDDTHPMSTPTSKSVVEENLVQQHIVDPVLEKKSSFELPKRTIRIPEKEEPIVDVAEERHDFLEDTDEYEEIYEDIEVEDIEEPEVEEEDEYIEEEDEYTEEETKPEPFLSPRKEPFKPSYLKTGNSGKRDPFNPHKEPLKPSEISTKPKKEVKSEPVDDGLTEIERYVKGMSRRAIESEIPLIENHWAPELSIMGEKIDRDEYLRLLIRESRNK